MPNNSAPYFSITGKNILITGGTHGIGAGISLLLVKSGANVLAAYAENDQAMRYLKDRLIDAPGKISFFKRDLELDGAPEDLVDSGLKLFGKIDALVSNLGPFLYRSIFETPRNEWDSMIHANLSTHFYLVKALLPHFRENRYGNFVFIGGVGSGQVTGHPMSAAYNAAKVGLAEFTKTLAHEEAPYNIRSNMIAPGIIDNGEYSENFRTRIIDQIPLGFIGEPLDIACAVRWLISDEARYVTGAVIDVAGGFNLNNK